MKYRKKPVVIDAIKWDGDREKLKTWVSEVSNGNPLTTIIVGMYDVRIITLEGRMDVSLGDYVIRGVIGEFYPCKPDIFEKTYEKVDEPSNPDKVIPS